MADSEDCTDLCEPGLFLKGQGYVFLKYLNKVRKNKPYRQKVLHEVLSRDQYEYFMKYQECHTLWLECQDP